MTHQSQEGRSSQKKMAVMIWLMMSLGPAFFFSTLLFFGILLLGVSRGWWAETDSPSDLIIFGPIIALLFAETIGGIFVSIARKKLTGTPFESHAISATRTMRVMIISFGLANCLIFSLLLIPNMNAIGAGLGAMFVMAFALPILFIWKTFRVVRGFRHALDGEPISDNPTRWS